MLRTPVDATAGGALTTVGGRTVLALPGRAAGGAGQLLRTRNGHAPGPPTSLEAVIGGGGGQLDVVRRAVPDLRARWDVQRLDERIAVRAAELGRTHPSPTTGRFAC